MDASAPSVAKHPKKAWNVQVKLSLLDENWSMSTVLSVLYIAFLINRLIFFQLFRSITSDSANFDPNRTQMMNSKKGRVVDASIAQAYIQQIRNADNFIYIENQV